MLVILTKQNILGQLPRDGKLGCKQENPQNQQFCY